MESGVNASLSFLQINSLPVSGRQLTQERYRAIPNGVSTTSRNRNALAVRPADMQKPRLKAAVFATRKEERKNEKDGR